MKNYYESSFLYPFWVDLAESIPNFIIEHKKNELQILIYPKNQSVSSLPSH